MNTWESRELIDEAITRLRHQEEEFYINILKSFPYVKNESARRFETIYSNIHDESILIKEVLKYKGKFPWFSQHAIKNVHNPEFIDRIVNDWEDSTLLWTVVSAINNCYNEKLLYEILMNVKSSNLELIPKITLQSEA